ncbi:hypothetical protein ABZ922_36110 [Streptomyces shenzhenensis]|uniref:hypothetical protein n=1 Tax=Streptomyces shenzhenensis TaxID=943815 RepID=UPI0033E36C20
MRRPGAPRIRLCIAAVGLAPLALAGCSGTGPTPAAEAVAHYEAVVAEAGAALGPEPTVGTGGDHEAWKQNIGPLEEALAGQGFSEFSDPHRMGATEYVEAHDEHGAQACLNSIGS